MILAQSWGPYTWYLFHCLSLSWNPKNIDKYIAFFNLIQKMIPCHICKGHFQRNLRKPKYNIRKNCSNGILMFKWLVDLHNEVNKMSHKRVLNYNQVTKQYLTKKGLKVNHGLILIFLREFIGYNIKLGGNPKQNAFQALKLLSFIYPSLKKRNRLRNMFKKNPNPKNKFIWLLKYRNILKK